MSEQFIYSIDELTDEALAGIRRAKIDETELCPNCYKLLEVLQVQSIEMMKLKLAIEEM